MEVDTEWLDSLILVHDLLPRVKDTTMGLSSVQSMDDSIEHKYRSFSCG